MRKSVLHAEGRICLFPGCRTKLSVYNSGKTCGIHPEVLTVKEARKSLTVELTDKQKAYCRKYKAKVRAGAKVKHRVVYGVPFPEAASKSMDKAIKESLKPGKRKTVQPVWLCVRPGQLKIARAILRSTGGNR